MKPEGSNINPPKWSLKFFRWFCNPDYVEDIEGDLLERFEKRTNDNRAARWLFVLDVIRLFRPRIIRELEGKKKFNSYDMFKNNLKISIRNLIKQKGYTAINLFGLTVGMAVSMLIILFILDQDKQDEHNAAADRIHRIITEIKDESMDKTRPYCTSPYELGQLIRFNIEEVEESALVIKAAGSVHYNDDSFNFNGLYVSPNFLSFFHFSLSEGDTQYALENQNSIVVSREFADKTFGVGNSLGQLVTIDSIGTFTVAGVIDNSHIKSHLAFDILLQEGAFTSKPANVALMEDWEAGATLFYNYIKLEETASPMVLKSYLGYVIPNIEAERQHLYSFDLQRLDQINLGRLVKNEIGITTPSFVAYFFGVLCLVLILSASFNYMNLAIARGLKRAKEVGIRKTIGANKRQIIGQFLVEAQLVVFASLIVAFLLLQILVPVFNDLKILRDIDGAITMNFNANLKVYLIFFLFAISVGLISGLYPALYLSSFKSLAVLKGIGGNKKSPSFLFRKILIFSQYSFSIVFIITTIILYQQARMFTDADYGFSHKHVINVPIRKSVPYETFRTELLKNKEIQGVSAISNLLVMSDLEVINIFNRASQVADIKTSFLSIDPYALDNLELRLVAGRNFSRSLITDRISSVIVNEKTIAALGFETANESLNETIEIVQGGKESGETAKVKIIGVVEDFSYQFVFRESGPLVMNFDPSKLNVINIKTTDIYAKEGAEIVESVWRKFNSVHPFKYSYYEYQMEDVNDEFAELVNMIGLVAFISIVIACLGQFSMVIHHVQLKVKEIGIRKVLGSNLNGLMLRMSKDFLIVILAAVLVASPVAWFINYTWTSKVYQSPDVSIIDISLGIVIILIMAFLTIFFQVKNAVNANPVDSLRSE
ncbi:MAG: FtsX-like permease family protein [Cyclobacteriaceae bacterium]